MILGSPGGDRPFIGPSLIARKTGGEPATAGNTKQSMYTGTSVTPSPIVINPSLTPPLILSTCFLYIHTHLP